METVSRFYPLMLTLDERDEEEGDRPADEHSGRKQDGHFVGQSWTSWVTRSFRKLNTKFVRRKILEEKLNTVRHVSTNDEQPRRPGMCGTGGETSSLKCDSESKASLDSGLCFEDGPAEDGGQQKVDKSGETTPSSDLTVSDSEFESPRSCDEGVVAGGQLPVAFAAKTASSILKRNNRQSAVEAASTADCEQRTAKGQSTTHCCRAPPRTEEAEPISSTGAPPYHGSDPLPVVEPGHPRLCADTVELRPKSRALTSIIKSPSLNPEQPQGAYKPCLSGTHKTSVTKKRVSIQEPCVNILPSHRPRFGAQRQLQKARLVTPSPRPVAASASSGSVSGQWSLLNQAALGQVHQTLAGYDSFITRLVFIMPEHEVREYLGGLNDAQLSGLLYKLRELVYADWSGTEAASEPVPFFDVIIFSIQKFFGLFSLSVDRLSERQRHNFHDQFVGLQEVCLRKKFNDPEWCIKETQTLYTKFWCLLLEVF